MSYSNARTIKAYDDYAQRYIDRTIQSVQGQLKQWLDDNLAQLDSTAKILEVGSGSGRDASYIESKGFTVERSDASIEFVRTLRVAGADARQLNVLVDSLGGPYDMIFANAVFHHFSQEEFGVVARKAYAALKPGGRFAFSTKEGEGDEWSAFKLGVARYFHYWRAGALEAFLRSVGFDQVACSVMKHYRSDDNDFLLITAIKSLEGLAV